jgi:hypothetical protein
MSQIHGMMMYPCSLNEEDHEKTWKQSDFYTEKDFMEEYRKHMVAMQHVAECAKIYILKNWESVKDWKDLNVIIRDNSGKDTEYFNHKKEERTRKGSKVWEEMLKRIEERDKEKHNPITSLTRVVLDTTDGDFSLTINGKDHLWINDESVIVIADFIEKTLSNGKTT